MNRLRNAEVPAALVRFGFSLSHTVDIPLVGGAVNFFNAARSPAWRQIPYYEAEPIGIDGKPADLPLIAEADPKARAVGEIIQAFKRKVVVVGAGRAALKEILKDTGGRPAAAVQIGEIVGAGVFPRGLNDLGIFNDEYIAGLRKGKAPLPVGLGSFIERESQFVALDSARIVEPDVAVADFDERFPGAHIV